MRRNRTFTEGSDASDHYKSVNERPVDDISLGIFLVYQYYYFNIFLDCHSTFSFDEIILDNREEAIILKKELLVY